MTTEKFYNISWDKIERAEDIVAVMAAINFNFHETHPRLHLIDHLLDKENPMVVNKTPVQNASFPTLPKLTTVKKNEDDDEGL